MIFQNRVEFCYSLLPCVTCAFEKEKQTDKSIEMQLYISTKGL